MAHVTDLAPALLAAETRRNSYMTLSFTGLDVPWIIYTSLPEILSLIKIFVSPSAKVFTSASQSGLPRYSETFYASSLFAFPAIKTAFLEIGILFFDRI